MEIRNSAAISALLTVTSIKKPEATASGFIFSPGKNYDLVISSFSSGSISSSDFRLSFKASKDSLLIPISRSCFPAFNQGPVNVILLQLVLEFFICRTRD